MGMECNSGLFLAGTNKLHQPSNEPRLSYFFTIGGLQGAFVAAAYGPQGVGTCGVAAQIYYSPAVCPGNSTCVWLKCIYLIRPTW